MEHIKESFKHDYNLAVKSFNEKDYTSFFRNIRPAIELLGKLAIYDILGKSDAADLLEGKTSVEWKRDTRTFKLIQRPPHHKPTGREFCELVPQVYYFKNSDVVTTRYDENKKRLKRGLDSCAGALSRYYSIASEFGSHTGNTEMDENAQAISCASFFMGYFDFMKSNKVLSSPTITFLYGLDLFQYDNPSIIAEAKQRIDELISEIEEKETALLSAQKLQAEAEQERLQAVQRTSEVESQLEALQKQIAELQEQLLNRDTTKIEVNDDSITPSTTESTQPQTIISRHFKEIMRGVAKGNDVDEGSMDDDQLDLIEYTTDKSMLVAGCAGSGKSVIAMHKAEQLYSDGKDVILIAYTKSLNSFMRVGKPDASFRFYYHYQWKKMNMPTADYIIVDEIQDFTREEIQDFISAAKKCFLFFGDTAQSIYRQYGKQTMTIAQIARMTGLNTLQLFNNYRLPRPVAKITQNYVGVDVAEYKEKVYQNKETELPRFVYTQTPEDEFNSITQIITSHPNKSIGILYYSNEAVLQMNKQLLDRGIQCEFKYNDTDGEKRNVSNLNFNTLIPKIMTYHSAKGLQFDIVVLPQYNGANDVESKKALYVAMTRTMHKLYVLYSTPELLSPLKEVPSHLYLKTL
ncbi:3'-5' exonuclease [uncultured Mediterranea sp.]|uniref:3'-5' exonuclease n=1 Tax=uncultured Mediterranea sp. TaxID=1926662 RepID=UPI00258A3C38|nr:3'-5' exonuclease [uncultured Mediterranea sp.]